MFYHVTYVMLQLGELNPKSLYVMNTQFNADLFENSVLCLRPLTSFSRNCSIENYALFHAELLLQ